MAGSNQCGRHLAGGDVHLVVAAESVHGIDYEHACQFSVGTLGSATVMLMPTVPRHK